MTIAQNEATRTAPRTGTADGGPAAGPVTTGRLAGWGRLSVPGREVLTSSLEEASRSAVLVRGLARSYGDASLPPPDRPVVVSSRRADRILALDEERGLLRAEAGLSLSEVLRLLLPRGFFPAVVPGTQYVTLGGMVAADVHGKNHHVAGCFGAHVTRLRVRTGAGDVLWCSPRREPDLFDAVVGGMGLVAHILEVEFRLDRVPTPWILAEHQRVAGIDAFVDALKESARSWPYTVGWIDCLKRGGSMGRGVLLRGRFARPDEAPERPPRRIRRVGVPFTAPSWLLSRPTVRAFNSLYYHSHGAGPRSRIVHPEPFFHPLDAVLNWNRLYGPRGFTQYQCVLPESAGREAVREFLDRLTRLGGASFLCVIKDCGPAGRGVLSFPMKGTSIALDVPMRPRTQRLVDTLNEFVAEVGGRIYLAKDALTRAEHFRRMEPRLERFLELRARYDPRRRIRSALSVRLFGDRP